jgi:hypothetical protein
MRVLVDVAERPGGNVTVMTAGGAVLPARPARWAAGRLLVARDAVLADEDAVRLADAVEAGVATPAELATYGKLLFNAVLDAAGWQRLRVAAAAEPCLEIAIRGTGPVQALRWEALHDGDAHVAARGAAGPGGARIPVGIVRLVPSGATSLTRIERMPRVLFAIGSRLTDPQVRAGAEFMGIMRHLERNGGAIYPRVLESATVTSLTSAITGFKPDIVHLIGHGRRLPGDEVRLQLQADGPGGGLRKDEYITAAQLLDILDDSGRRPAMVVLSACQTASGRGGRGQAGDERRISGHLNGLPFAAQLVAGGVPVVVAMAGDIADTACRVFTRALTLAIEGGLPLAEAAVRGRRAAFVERPEADSTDWVLPAIFTGEQIDGDVPLVDKAAIDVVRRRIQQLELDDEPVFFGRGEFVTAMDLLLDPASPLNVLVAYTRDPYKRYGGWRLLRELAARSVRAGCLPVLLGPCDQAPLDSRAAFARAIDKQVGRIRRKHGLSPAESRVVSVAASPRADADDLADAVRADFERLVADLPDTDPVKARPYPDSAAGLPAARIVLFCHHVDTWAGVLEDLQAALGSDGLGSGVRPVPVVLTGVDQGTFHEDMDGRWRGPGWVRCLPLDWFRSDDNDAEDILAYQTWLLNPPDRLPVKYPVFAPRRGAPTDWHGLLRDELEDRGVLYHPVIFRMAAKLPTFFTSDRDDDLLAGFEAVGGDG